MLKTPEKFFDISDTLNCGQVFRYTEKEGNYTVISDKECAFVGKDGIIKSTNDEYFYNYFDFDRDYSAVYSATCSFGIEILKKAAMYGKGVRILNQDKTEIIISFILSQNNNIPRIKGILSRMCAALGQEREFLGEKYYAFPSLKKLASKDAEFYYALGMGYRAPYIAQTAVKLLDEDISSWEKLTTQSLKEKLLTFKGIGPKVADCISLFGFGRTDSFPVDTWIEKIYREDFKGELKDRNKITDYFTELFGENSGFIQQYLFYYKREKKLREEKKCHL